MGVEWGGGIDVKQSCSYDAWRSTGGFAFSTGHSPTRWRGRVPLAVRCGIANAGRVIGIGAFSVTERNGRYFGHGEPTVFAANA